MSRIWRHGKSRPGVKVSAGDALFVRTGVWARRKKWGHGCAAALKGAGRQGLILQSSPGSSSATSPSGSDHPQYVSPSPLRGAVRPISHCSISACTSSITAIVSRAAQMRRRTSAGISADSGAASSRRHWFAGEPHRDVLRDPPHAIALPTAGGAGGGLIGCFAGAGTPDRNAHHVRIGPGVRERHARHR